MSDGRVCPACGAGFADRNPARRWCSASCRTWVWKVGGHAAAAALLQSWGDAWLRNGNLVDRSVAEERAAALHARAEVMRGYAP